MFEKEGEEGGCVRSKDYFTPMHGNVSFKILSQDNWMLFKQLELECVRQSMQNGSIEIEYQQSFSGHFRGVGNEAVGLMTSTAESAAEHKLRGNKLFSGNKKQVQN